MGRKKVGIQWRESQRIRLVVEGLGNEKEVQTEVGLSDNQCGSGCGPKYMNVWISDSITYWKCTYFIKYLKVCKDWACGA